jgi:hypothetical protein
MVVSPCGDCGHMYVVDKECAPFCDFYPNYLDALHSVASILNYLDGASVYLLRCWVLAAQVMLCIKSMLCHVITVYVVHYPKLCHDMIKVMCCVMLSHVTHSHNAV